MPQTGALHQGRKEREQDSSGDDDIYSITVSTDSGNSFFDGTSTSLSLSVSSFSDLFLEQAE